MRGGNTDYVGMARKRWDGHVKKQSRTPMTDARKLARERGEKRYVTGRPCKEGHYTERLVSTGCCIECSKTLRANWQKNNREKIIASQKKWVAKNKEHMAMLFRNWKEKNREKYNSSQAKRRANKLLAMPKWVSDIELLKIKEIYKKAIDVTKETGIPHDVDHIVPLQSKIVCGLHVSWNLKIIPSSDNAIKGNRIWPQMP